MFSLVYASSAIEHFSPSQLTDLLTTSHENNAALGVTGMLLYKDGNFMQVLEGDEAVVRNLYAHIGLDPRHRGLITMIQSDRGERQFSNWSMGFRDLNSPEVASAPGYSEFLNVPLTDPAFLSDPSRCHKLLATFKAIM